MSQAKRKERFYFQSGTMDRPDSGHARGFEEVWQAEQYLDEEREHSVAAGCRSGNTQVLRIIDNQAPYQPRTIYAEYVHGDKPEELKLSYGDYVAVVKVMAIDSVPGIMSGVFDDLYHQTDEALSSTDIDNLGEACKVLVEAYYESLRAPIRARYEGHTERPTLASLKKERA